MTRRQVLVLALVVEAGMGAVAIGLGLWFDLPVAEWGQGDLEGLGWGMAGALVLLGILMLCQRSPGGAIGRLMHFVEATVKPLFRECGVIDLLLVSILAGVGEELFFRGLVQGGLEGWFGKWGALGMASVVFGLAHCMTREYVVFAAGLGLLLGWLAIVTGNLFASIIAHAGYDFVALLMLTKESRREGSRRKGREWEG